MASIEFTPDDPDDLNQPVRLGEIWPSYTLRFLDSFKNPVELDPCFMEVKITSNELVFSSRIDKNHRLKRIIVPVSKFRMYYTSW